MAGAIVGTMVGVGAGLGDAAPSLAHGTNIQHQITSAVKIQAAYDTGEPMAEAQVSVYAPDDPQQPWMTGLTNEQGEFIFTPDNTLSGNWEVQVRQAGHGDIVTIPWDASASDTAAVAANNTATASTGYTTAQLLLMGATGVWGLVGTALFFSRRQG